MADGKRRPSPRSRAPNRGRTITAYPYQRHAVALALTLIFAAAHWAQPGAAARIAVRPSQQLATLATSQLARSHPSEGATSMGLVQAVRPITGERTVLPVLAHKSSASGLRWLKVRLPGRPNGLTGWIEEAGTTVSNTSWHIVIDTTTRQAVIYDRGRPEKRFRVIVGKPATPTPNGQFFVEEDVALGPRDVGAPFALALSARSDVLQEFDGGPGQIALHGLANIGGTLGTAASHGCIRLNAEAMNWLVSHITPGVPVTITA